jgi:hypothetical protein
MFRSCSSDFSITSRRLGQLAWHVTVDGSIRLGAVRSILFGLILSYTLQPSEVVFHFAELYSPQLVEELCDRWACFVTPSLVFKDIALGSHGDGFHRYKSCCCASRSNFIEGR